MRRIFQIGMLLLLSTIFLAPVFEMFDRWDAPGLGNDTELSGFCIVLLLCLLLCLLIAACTLIRRFGDRSKEELVPIVWPDEPPSAHLAHAFNCKLVIPPITAPLRV